MSVITAEWAIVEKAPSGFGPDIGIRRHGIRYDSLRVHTSIFCNEEHMAYKGFDLSGRSAVVIGGTSGIGHAMALGAGGSRCRRGAYLEAQRTGGADGD